MRLRIFQAHFYKEREIFGTFGKICAIIKKERKGEKKDLRQAGMNILITGASSGIGFAVANALAEKGANVFVCDRVSRDFEKENIRFFQADVTKEEELSSVKEELEKKGLALDCIVNVAGVFMIDSFLEADPMEMERLFQVNLFGVMNVNRVFYPLLKKDGRIVITTSDVATLDPMPFNGIYNVSKTALDCYAQSLRQELNLLGQKVITVRPGAFDTGLSRGSLEKTAELMEKTELYKAQSAKFYKLVKRFMGKPQKPEKIVKIYCKACFKKHPKLIYRKHSNFLLRILDILPKRLQCFVIKCLLK